MFSKLMKWLSSDRSEEPAAVAPELPSAAISMLCVHVKEQHDVSIDEPAMREVARLLRKRNKIEAIKVIREKTRLGLKESKDIADDLEGVMKRA